MIDAEGIDAMEFPDLSDRYNVNGVPQTTINEGAGTLVGAAPEERLLAEVLRAIHSTRPEQSKPGLVSQ